MDFNPVFLLILYFISRNILSRSALFMALRSPDLQAKKHSFQTLKVEFPTSISPCFTLSFSQYFIWISPGYVFKSTWILGKNTFLLVTKYQLSNLQLSLFFSQDYSPHPARHIPSLRLPKVKSKDFPRKVYIPL